MLFTVPYLPSRIFRLVLKEKLYCVRKYTIVKPFRLLFFGSDGIALKSLRKVNEFRKRNKLIGCLDLVTTNVSKNKTEIEKYAETENIKTLSWPLQNLHPAEYDLGLIVAFGHLIKQDVLNQFPLGMVNVHPSLLPRWRGAAPIIHTLLHGDEITGVTLMKIKPDIFDVGEIISQTKIEISNDIRLPHLTEQLSEIGAEMLVECIRNLPQSLENAKVQSKDGVSYAKKISKSISEVQWSEMSAIQVYNLFRALYGIYPLTTKFRDKQIKLFDAFLGNSEVEKEEKPVGSLEYCKNTNALRVLCKDRKNIYFKSVRIIGKRQISALDFYNGYIRNMSLEKRMCGLVKNQ